MRRWTVAFVLIFCFVSIANRADAQSPYSEIVVFGDSLSDTGISFAISGIPPTGPDNFPYFEGRFSNGPIWIDYLQQTFGLSDSQVLNFAIGGSSTGFGFEEPPAGIFEVPPGLVLPTIGTQIAIYKSIDQPRDGQLFVVWAGANDLFRQKLPFFAALNMELHIRQLAAAGADEFLVPNLPPLGSTPLVNESLEGLFLNLATLSFNFQLNHRMDRLEDELGITIHRLDVFGLTAFGLANPEAFGFSNVTNSALADIESGAITREEGATYLFWDVIHPTSLTHGAIAGEAASVLTGQ